MTVSIVGWLHVGIVTASVFVLRRNHYSVPIVYLLPILEHLQKYVLFHLIDNLLCYEFTHSYAREGICRTSTQSRRLETLASQVTPLLRLNYWCKLVSR